MPTKAVKQVAVDVEGSDAVTRVLLDLLNEFPGLKKLNARIAFSTLGDTGGIGFFPTSGAVLTRNDKDITGHVRQVCLYPFIIMYRVRPQAEESRIAIKEFLDTLGYWLELQPVTIDGETFKLEAYPSLGAGGRVIKSIARTNAGRLVQSGPVEDWGITASLRYENEYDE